MYLFLYGTRASPGPKLVVGGVSPCHIHVEDFMPFQIYDVLDKPCLGICKS